MAYLIGISENVKDQRFEISKERATFGRNSANDVIIDDPTVSSQHCYIALRGGRYVIHDLNSTNGTAVEGERITEVELKPNQRLTIGAVEFEFVIGDEKPGSDIIPANTTTIIANTVQTVMIPKSFSSVSPLGTKRKESRGTWIAVVIVFGILALIGVALLVIKLKNFGN